jgi:AcrR family transcriptional regulator
MRVTSKTKQRTRAKILQETAKLFQQKGFEETTTRDIAARAGIATGTLFNYFPTKEALALAIVGKRLEEAREEFRARLRGDEDLNERLFAHVATSLRHLREHRGYLGQLLERSRGPIAGDSADVNGAEAVRSSHLATVREILSSNGAREEEELSELTLHLYWTLFLGVVSFWAADRSPHQEDTLVLLDQSMTLYVNSLSMDSTAKAEGDHEEHTL